MLLAVCKLSSDVTGYEDPEMSLVRFDLSIVTVEQVFIVSQTVGYQSSCRC